jgi:hypothetical protein
VESGRCLIHPQPTSGRPRLGLPLLVQGRRELGGRGAQRAGRVLTRHARAAAGAGMGDELFLARQLDPGGDFDPAVPLVAAAAIGPPQRLRYWDCLRRFQAEHLAELPG